MRRKAAFAVRSASHHARLQPNRQPTSEGVTESRPDEPPDPELGLGLLAASEHFDSLSTAAGSEEPAWDTLGRELQRLEDRVLRHDDDVPPAALPPHLATNPACQAQALCRYARLLASRPFSLAGRFEHFDLVCTELLCSIDQAGRYSLRPRDEARALLREILGGFDTPQDAQEAQTVASGFTDAAARLAATSSLESLLGDGVYMDLYGYKLAHRNALKHPEVLYGAVSLNAELHNFVEAHRGCALSREECSALLAQQRAQVREILEPAASKPLRRTSPSDATLRRLSAEPARSTPETQRRATPTNQQRSTRNAETLRRRKLVAVTAVATCVVVLAGAWLAGRATHGVTALQRAELERLSPLLERGWLVEELGSTHLKGAARQHLWQAMRQSERQDAAAALVASLRAAHVQNAIVQAGDATAIEIHQGMLVQLQPQQ